MTKTQKIVLIAFSIAFLVAAAELGWIWKLWGKLNS